MLSEENPYGKNPPLPDAVVEAVKHLKMLSNPSTTPEYTEDQQQELLKTLGALRPRWANCITLQQTLNSAEIERRAPDMVPSDNRRRDFAIRTSAARVRGAPSACGQRQAGRQAAQFEFQTKLRGGKAMDYCHPSRRNRAFKSLWGWEPTNACFLFIKFGLPLESEVLDRVDP